MMNVVCDTYLKIHNQPVDTFMKPEQVQALLSLWFSCTRSVSTSHPDFKNMEALEHDHRTLGIMKEDGILDENRIEKLAQVIWADPHHYPDFETLKST